MPEYPFLKGHGTENDFVLLPDHDGSVHGWLDAQRVRALCDRRAGIGGDGVLRVIRTASYEGPDAALVRGQAAEWFMDYRNADGSMAEMCGNGSRVFVRHLVDSGLVAGSELEFQSRAGVVRAVVGDEISVALRRPEGYGHSQARVGDRTLPGAAVDVG